MNIRKLSRIVTPAMSVAALAAGLGSAGAGTVTATSGKEPAGKNVITEAPKEESVFDKIWGLARLYHNDSNPIIEELNFVGRYQGQYYNVDGGDSSTDDWDNRRFRLGLRGKLFDKHVEFYTEMFSDLNSGGDFYAGLKNFWISYKVNDAFVLKVGKMEPTFSYDYSRSDTLLNTFERSALINQFKNEYAPGVVISGKVDKFSYYGGAYSNQVDKEFGKFDGGWSISAGIGYDLKDAWGLDTANWRLDYLHSEHESNDTVLTGFDDGLATSLEIKRGSVGLITELQAGFGHSNTFGLMLEPTFDITTQLQLVARYQLGLSDESHGLSPQSRYEKLGGVTAGDTYNAGYLGLNYKIYGDKFKLMTGIEYANMSGGKSGSNDSWTYLAGVRVYW